MVRTTIAKQRKLPNEWGVQTFYNATSVKKLKETYRWVVESLG